MMDTVYFISRVYSSGGGQQPNQLALAEVVEKKNQFMNANKNAIQEVVDERLEFSFCGNNNGYYVFATITLSYYNKDNQNEKNN